MRQKTVDSRAIAVASDKTSKLLAGDVAVMQQPVEDRRGDDRVAEHAALFGHRAVARHQHRAALVATADPLEEQVCRIGLERQVAQLVDHQQRAW